MHDIEGNFMLRSMKVQGVSDKSNINNNSIFVVVTISMNIKYIIESIFK